MHRNNEIKCNTHNSDLKRLKITLVTFCNCKSNPIRLQCPCKTRDRQKQVLVCNCRNILLVRVFQNKQQSNVLRVCC